jgi:flagellar protein FliS
MLATYARSQYQEMQVQTTPGKLIVMLYDGALRFLHLGLDALQRDDAEALGLNLGKAQNILCELVGALDMHAGEIAAELNAIYCYCLQRLLIANADNNAAPIEEVIRLLAELRDAWDHAERVVRSGEAEAAVAGRTASTTSRQSSPAADAPRLAPSIAR